jgi:hypothetical protein
LLLALGHFFGPSLASFECWAVSNHVSCFPFLSVAPSCAWFCLLVRLSLWPLWSSRRLPQGACAWSVPAPPPGLRRVAGAWALDRPPPTLCCCGVLQLLGGVTTLFCTVFVNKIYTVYVRDNYRITLRFFSEGIGLSTAVLYTYICIFRYV